MKSQYSAARRTRCQPPRSAPTGASGARQARPAAPARLAGPGHLTRLQRGPRLPAGSTPPVTTSIPARRWRRHRLRGQRRRQGVRVDRSVVSISAPDCQFYASVTGYAAAAASVQIRRISHDGCGQRSPRSATDIPEQENPAESARQLTVRFTLTARRRTASSGRPGVGTAGRGLVGVKARHSPHRAMSILHLASPWTAWPCVTIVAGCSQGHHRPGTGVRMAWRAANASWRCSGTSQAC